MDSLIGLFVLLVVGGLILCVWLFVKLVQALLGVRGRLSPVGWGFLVVLVLIVLILGSTSERPEPYHHRIQTDPVCTGCEAHTDPACQPPCEQPGDCLHAGCGAAETIDREPKTASEHNP